MNVNFKLRPLTFLREDDNSTVIDLNFFYWGTVNLVVTHHRRLKNVPSVNSLFAFTNDKKDG